MPRCIANTPLPDRQYPHLIDLGRSKCAVGELSAWTHNDNRTIKARLPVMGVCRVRSLDIQLNPCYARKNVESGANKNAGVVCMKHACCVCGRPTLASCPSSARRLLVTTAPPRPRPWGFEIPTANKHFSLRGLNSGRVHWWEWGSSVASFVRGTFRD